MFPIKKSYVSSIDRLLYSLINFESNLNKNRTLFHDNSYLDLKIFSMTIEFQNVRMISYPSFMR